MIQAKGIHKSFGSNDVLKGVDVDFHQGETNLIIGRSGSGKTVFSENYIRLARAGPGRDLIRWGSPG